MGREVFVIIFILKFLFKVDLSLRLMIFCVVKDKENFFQFPVYMINIYTSLADCTIPPITFLT